MPLDPPDISELKAIVDWANVNEDVRQLSIKYGDVELSFSRDRPTPGAQLHGAAALAPSSPAAAPAAAPTAPAPAAAEPAHASTAVAPAVAADALASDEVLIKAPMVGTFYASPKPGADAFVSVGDAVEASTVLGIVEVMKLMNNIEARVEGTVARILVENEQAVEYGQPLIVIRRNG